MAELVVSAALGGKSLWDEWWYVGLVVVFAGFFLLGLYVLAAVYFSLPLPETRAARDARAMAEREPSIIKEGGYQGSSDPGKPTSLMQQQTHPAQTDPEATKGTELDLLAAWIAEHDGAYAEIWGYHDGKTWRVTLKCGLRTAWKR